MFHSLILIWVDYNFCIWFCSTGIFLQWVFSCLFEGDFGWGGKHEHDFLLDVFISLSYFGSWHHLLCISQLEKYLLKALAHQKMGCCISEEEYTWSFLRGGGNRGYQNRTQFLRTSKPLLPVCLKSELVQNPCNWPSRSYICHKLCFPPTPNQRWSPL